MKSILLILSILIGHLWTDRAVAKEQTAHKVVKAADGATHADTSHKHQAHAPVKKETVEHKKSAPPMPKETKAVHIKPSETVPVHGQITAPVTAPVTGPEKVPSVEPEKTPADALELSIDTVDAESGGNWLNKRIWFEHAQDALHDIAQELSDILTSRQQYLETRNTLDDLLEQTFIDLGFSQGRLDQLLSHLLDLIAKEQQERGDLSAAERALRHKIEVQQKDLEQLKLDLEALKNLDDSLDATVKRVIEQINLAGTYNKEAHDAFDQIPNANEKKAHELYYKIDALLKDMLAIKAYLTGQLAQYLQQVNQNAHMHVAKLKSEVAAIQAKGLDFKKEIARFERADISVEERRAAERERQAREEEPEPEPGFFGRAWDWLTGWFG